MSYLSKVGLSVLFSLLFTSVACLFVYQHVKGQWNADIKVREALLKSELASNKVTLESLNTQHTKDIENAKTKAGRAAVNKWIADNWVLPDRLPVCQTTGTDKTINTGVSDGKSGEQRPWGGITEFAVRCAKDALKVTDWQELAIRENWKIIK